MNKDEEFKHLYESLPAEMRAFARDIHDHNKDDSLASIVFYMFLSMFRKVDQELPGLKVRSGDEFIDFKIQSMSVCTKNSAKIYPLKLNE